MRGPVASLPNELLVYIFDLAHLSSDALMKDWIGWLYLCRRWYHILVSMPRFWRDIYVSARAEWLELFPTSQPISTSTYAIPRR